MYDYAIILYVIIFRVFYTDTDNYVFRIQIRSTYSCIILFFSKQVIIKSIFVMYI